MAEPLIIVGAGGHGRETAFAFLLDAPPTLFLGFLDDRATGTTPEGWPVIGTIADAAAHRKARFHVAVNDPRIRRAIVRRMNAAATTAWATIVHPDVRVHRSSSIGAGAALLGGCQVTVSARIGDHCIVNRGAQVGHDCHVGPFCSLNPSAALAGGVRVDDGCEIGSGSAIRQQLKVGAGATIGMGAVVVKDVPSGAVVVGNPAYLLRSNDPW